MTWQEILAPAMDNPRIIELRKYLKNERRKGTKIYPSGNDVFRAFNLCPFEKTKVVLLGQDVYHTHDTADGLCFSTRQTKRPPSLRVIFKEIFKDFNVQYFHEENYESFFPTNSLENWAANGFLLLNTILTVEGGKPGSHKDLGWEVMMDEVFKGLNNKKEPVIFLLWGKFAEAYRPRIADHHLSLIAPHPAAELNGQQKAIFSGCGHFSAIRDILPTLAGDNLFRSFNLDYCFDKEKAKKLVREQYPLNAESLSDYIDKELMINIPVNRKVYWEHITNFEKSLSTKLITNG